MVPPAIGINFNGVAVAAASSPPGASTSSSGTSNPNPAGPFSGFPYTRQSTPPAFGATNSHFNGYATTPNRNSSSASTGTTSGNPNGNSDHNRSNTNNTPPSNSPTNEGNMLYSILSNLLFEIKELKETTKELKQTANDLKSEQALLRAQFSTFMTSGQAQQQSMMSSVSHASASSFEAPTMPQTTIDSQAFPSRLQTQQHQQPRESTRRPNQPSTSPLGSPFPFLKGLPYFSVEGFNGSAPTPFVVQDPDKPFALVQGLVAKEGFNGLLIAVNHAFCKIFHYEIVSHPLPQSLLSLHN